MYFIERAGLSAMGWDNRRGGNDRDRIAITMMSDALKTLNVRARYFRKNNKATRMPLHGSTCVAYKTRAIYKGGEVYVGFSRLYYKMACGALAPIMPADPVDPGFMAGASAADFMAIAKNL